MGLTLLAGVVVRNSRSRNDISVAKHVRAASSRARWRVVAVVLRYFVAVPVRAAVETYSRSPGLFGWERGRSGNRTPRPNAMGVRDN
jgi:hypothetical protein